MSSSIFRSPRMAAAKSGHPQTVRLLDHEPGLAEGLTGGQFEAARRASIAAAGVLERGPWHPRPEQFQPGSFGLLLLDGLLTRRVSLGDRTCAEVVGPGDVLRPWVTTGPGASIRSDVNWAVVQRARFALLDRNFVARMCPWPEIIAGVGNRVMLRVHWLAFHMAVCHMRRVDERLLAVLWHFADRWGRVTPDGVVVPAPFTHGLLASIVGAQRPTVSTVTARLADAGVVARLPDRSWLLRGSPPPHLTAVHGLATDDGGAAPGS